MDLELVNLSELSRRLKLTPGYVHQLIRGVRTSEKRLQQIADALKMSLAELKQQMKTKNKIGHADKHALAHSQTYGSRVTGRNSHARNLKRFAA
jgi:transcriptional regulator with XRE-family HTH domain